MEPPVKLKITTSLLMYINDLKSDRNRVRSYPETSKWVEKLNAVCLLSLESCACYGGIMLSTYIDES